MPCYRQPAIRNLYPRRGLWGKLDPRSTEAMPFHAPSGKLTLQDVEEIRRRAAAGVPQVEIVQELAKRGKKVSKSTVSQVVTKKRWGDLAAIENQELGLRSMSERDRRAIEMYDSGDPVSEIADFFNVAISRIYQILNKTISSSATRQS